MLRKYSLRLRETTRQLEEVSKGADAENPAATGSRPATLEHPVQAPKAAPQGAEALAYFISKASGNAFPVFKGESLIGRYDSVTGMSPEIDLTNEDQSRNISRRHARLVLKNGQFHIAEEIGTMNGTFLNGRKLANGALTPIDDGDELTLCRLTLTFRLPSKSH